MLYYKLPISNNLYIHIIFTIIHVLIYTMTSECIEQPWSMSTDFAIELYFLFAHSARFTCRAPTVNHHRYVFATPNVDITLSIWHFVWNDAFIRWWWTEIRRSRLVLLTEQYSWLSEHIISADIDTNYTVLFMSTYYK